MTDFKTTLARLMEGADNGLEGSTLYLRDLLEDNAAAILALFEAAEKANCANPESMREMRRCVNHLTGESHD